MSAVKRSIAIALCLILCLSLLPISALAKSGGKCGDKLTWSLDNGVLTISGTGAMEQYDFGSPAPWGEESERITSVEIDSGVTGIGSFAFDGLSSLRSVTIPESVTSIGGYAFFGCSMLTDVKLPEGITNIDDGLFAGCVRLWSIKLPKGVTRIGNSAFFNCRGLSRVTIPEGVTGIDDRAFDGCSGLTELTLPKSVTSIGESAFSGCPITKLSYDGTDSQWNALKNEYDRTGEKLWSLSVQSSGKSDKSVKKCGDDLTWSLKGGVLTISGTGGMSDYDKGGVPPWHGQRESIRELRIESGVTGLGRNAFDGCTRLSDIWYYGTAAQWESMENGFVRENKSLLGAAVHIPPPAGNRDECGDGLTWSLKDGVLKIDGKGRMYDYQIETVRPPWSRQRFDIVRVEIGSGVTHVGDCAFDYIAVGPNDISSLQSVSIPKTVTSIGSNAFGRCSALTELTIPESVTTIGSAAFKECGSLTGHLSIPKGTTRIYPYAFQYCKGLTEITIPESVTEIGHSAFDRCDSLTDVYYGGTAAQWETLCTADNGLAKELAGVTIHTN